MTATTIEMIEGALLLSKDFKAGGLPLSALLTENIAQRLRELDKPDCVWTNGDSDEEFETQCGNVFTFIDGGINDNNCKFCQYCGGAVKQS